MKKLVKLASAAAVAAAITLPMQSAEAFWGGGPWGGYGWGGWGGGWGSPIGHRYYPDWSGYRGPYQRYPFWGGYGSGDHPGGVPGAIRRWPPQWWYCPPPRSRPRSKRRPLRLRKRSK